ncbi:MAG: hypothetical protein ABR968_00240 [Bacteroidales bacterium]|jgi:hypothetical protein
MKNLRYILIPIIIATVVLTFSVIISSNINTYSRSKTSIVDIGQKAPDITMKNPNDSVISLYSI